MFIHDALVELILCNETEITAVDIRVIMRRLMRPAPTGNITGFQAQFEVCQQEYMIWYISELILNNKILEQMTSNIKNLDISNATMDCNITKNRYQDLKVPCKSQRNQ